MELILSTEKKAAKFSSSENLINAINAEQEFSRFRHLCSKYELFSIKVLHVILAIRRFDNFSIEWQEKVLHF